MSQYDKCTIWYEKLFDQIPVICASNNQVSNQRLILLYHQYLDRKESMLNFAFRLAQENYFTVCIDIDRHGDRNNYDKKFPSRELYNVVFQTAEEVSSVIDYFAQIYNIHTDNVAALGVSLGGKVALASSMKDERITHVASLLSAPNFPKIANEHKEKVLTRFFADNSTYSKEYLREINENAKIYDPYFNIEKFTNKQSLFINGTLDTTFPISMIKDFQEKLHKYNEKNDSIHEFVAMPGTGHQINNEMIGMTMEWIKKNY